MSGKFLYKNYPGATDAEYLASSEETLLECRALRVTVKNRLAHKNFPRETIAKEGGK